MNVYIGTNSLKNAYIGEVWKPNANTLAYYPLESNANDYSGNSRNGTAGSGVQFTTQNGIKCCYVNGGDSNGKIQIPGLGTLSSLTASIRIKSTDTNRSQMLSLCPSSDNANFQMLGPSTLDCSRWNGSNSDYKSTNIAGNNGLWHNFICTNGSDGLKLYVDGILGASSTNVRTVKSDTNYSMIGRWIYPASNIVFYINNVIIEDKVRTDTEILNYYNNTKSNYGL